MKKLVLLSITILAFTTLNAQKKVKGNGKMTTVTRSTETYNSIYCTGSFDYILVAGKEGNITLEGEENLLEHIETKVKDGKLVIKVENNKQLKTSMNKGIKITIPFQDIEGVALAGSGDLWNEDVITANTFKAALAGSGDVTLKINASHVKGSLAGSGDLTLKGVTENLDASVAGSGDFHGFDLEAQNTEVNVAGSGDAQVVSKKSLKARVSGSGDISYRGNPEFEDTKVAGSGSIRK